MAGAFDAGSVVARLTLDLKDWSANVDRAKTDITTFGGVVNAKKDDIEKMGKAFTAAGVAISGALGLMLKSATDYTLEIGRMSTRTGIATETLSGLSQAADKSGLSMDGLGVGLKRYSSLAFDASRGNQAAVETMKRLGVSAVDASGKLKPMDQLLMETADKFKAMPNGIEKSALAVDLFGRSGTEMIAMLNRGSDGIRGFTDEAREAGQIITSEGVAKAKAFTYSLKDLDDAFMGVKLVIANAIMPVVKAAADAFGWVVIKVRQVMDIFPPLTGTITIMIGAFGALMAILGPMLLMLPQLVKGWQIFAGWLPIVQTRLAAVGTSATAVIGVFAGVVLAIQAVTWAINKYSDSCDRAMSETVRTAEESAKGWRFVRESIAGSTSVSKEAIERVIASQRSMGHGAEEIGETIYKMFRLKIASSFKAVAKDAEDMVKKVIDAQKQLADKIASLTKNEFDYRIFQAKQYYTDLKAQVKGSADEARIAAEADKALAMEVAKIRKEQAEAAANVQKAAAEKSAQAGKEQWGRWEEDGKFAGDSIQQTLWKVNSVAVDVAKFIASTFGVSFGKIVSQGKDAPVKVQSAFSKAMDKIGDYVQVIQQGFGQFFSAIQTKSDNYYKAEFAKLDKLFAKQKDALAKEYNDKIAQLDAKDAAEALAARKHEIITSKMTQAEKDAALAEIDAEQAKIEERKKIDADYAAAQEALEIAQTTKRKALEKQQAEANKKSAITQAYINMFAAITASWKLGFPLGAIAAAIAAAACMIQIKAIKSQVIPEMASGGLINQPTHVLAGEDGPEAILPMRELKRMLGIDRKGGGGNRSVTFGPISAIDATGLDALFSRKIIPMISRALGNESLTIPVHAVR